MSEVKLLPCPFCGNKAGISVVKTGIGQTATICCSACTARKVVFREPLYNGDIEKDATDVWYQRALAIPVDTEQTRLETFLKLFPSAHLDENGLPDFFPQALDRSVSCKGKECRKCVKEYWNAKIGD